MIRLNSAPLQTLLLIKISNIFTRFLETSNGFGEIRDSINVAVGECIMLEECKIVEFLATYAW